MWATTFHIDEGHFKNLYKCTYHDKCIHEICKFNLRKGLCSKYANTIHQFGNSSAHHQCQNAELNLKKGRTLVHTKVSRPTTSK